MSVAFNSTQEAMRRLASFIPRDDRIKLFMTLYDMQDGSAQRTAKALGIHPRQVYFYLPGRRGRIRNFPNDQTTYLILNALARKDPHAALAKMKDLAMEFSAILEYMPTEEQTED